MAQSSRNFATLLAAASVLIAPWSGSQAAAPATDLDPSSLASTGAEALFPSKPPIQALLDGGVSLGELPAPAKPAAVPGSTARRSVLGLTLLEEYVAQAERIHPRLRSARESIEMARGHAVQVRLYPNPVIAGFTPQAAGSDSQWSGTVAQDIVTAGKLRLQQQAALRQVQRTEYEFVRARFDVLSGVRQSFYSLLVAQRRAQIYRMLLEISKRSFDIGTQLVEAGESAKGDVLFLSIEYDRAQVRVLNADVVVETSRRELAAAAAVPRESIPWVEGDLFADLPDFDVPGLQEEVIRANAKPRAAAAEVARARWTLDRALVQPIPNVNLMGGYQRQADFPPQDQGLAQVMMAVPLFDRNQGNIRSARADIAKAQADLRTVELDLAYQTAQIMAEYRTAQRMVAWYEEAILPKARETVRIMQRLYSEGEINFLRLLEAQRILTETELAFVDAQERRWTGAVSIADLLQLEEFPPRGDDPAARTPPPVNNDVVRPLPPVENPPTAAADVLGEQLPAPRALP